MSNLLSETKYLCRQYGLKPKRESGQNFLINQKVFKQIIQAAELSLSDRVVEIGAGFGTLTQRLAKKVSRVWAVELEKRFIASLLKLKKVYPTIEVIKDDILKINIGNLLKGGPYKIVANLPYNITSLVLKNFLSCDPKPNMMVLLLQKEVAERITAKPSDLSLLAVSVQFYAQPKIIQPVSKKNFWPEPKVDSAIVKIENIKTSQRIDNELKEKGWRFTEKDFFQVVRAGFSAKRKQVHNNLAASFHLENEKIKNALRGVGIDPMVRPQDLSLEEWKALTVILKQEGVVKS